MDAYLEAHRAYFILKHGETLIIYLYMNDLIFTSNDMMIHEF